MRFEGKVALVTGSGRNIGRDIALRLAREGADVGVNFFRKRAPAEATADEIRALGRQALAVRADVSKPEGLRALFGAVEAEFGGLDIFVHNAASGYNRPALQQRVKGWDWTLNVNARAALFGAQHAVRLMERRGGGTIVNISSLGAHRVLPDYVLVGASKAALEALTRYLAVELAPLGIRVNAVSAGVIDTDALRFFPSIAERFGDDLRGFVERTPAGRLVTGEDIAAVVAFLCSPDAAMIRGQVIMVDGGFGLLM
jgi:enoyl-[acyl-carrier protein] reductase III